VARAASTARPAAWVTAAPALHRHNMASITALLHTENDALRVGRVLETLYPCDQILVVDHASRDASVRIAREYGARVVDAADGVSPADYLRSAGFRSAHLQSASLQSANPGWILCLDPREALTESLAASLFEWKSESFPGKAPAASAFSVFLREETAEGWVEVPAAQIRLVPPSWNLWKDRYPAYEPSALALEGELLRFVFP
jgi:hypothetical protein